ncbi:MAG: hypothetical protein DRN04_09015 [Thermoprotei archaeon]|nr:MAG: hypothetical protein DRN04_09015 [Thermoprotei archaeon]
MKKIKLDFRLEKHFYWGAIISGFILWYSLSFTELSLAERSTFIVLGILAGIACVYGRAKSVLAALLLYFTSYYYLKLAAAVGFIDFFRTFFETFYESMLPAFILFWTVVLISGIVGTNFSPERSFFWTFVTLIAGYTIVNLFENSVEYVLLSILPANIYYLIEASIIALVSSTIIAIIEKYTSMLKYSAYIAVFSSLAVAALAYIAVHDYVLASIISLPALVNTISCVRRK